MRTSSIKASATADSKSVVAVVLNWNGKLDTIECLESLFRVRYTACHVVVVDNGSSDGSPSEIKEKFPQVELICNDSNLGFAEGNNIGVRYALQKFCPDYFLLLNNDAVVDQNLVAELIRTVATDSRIGLVQPMILRYGDQTINTAGNLCDLFGATGLRGAREKDVGQYFGDAEGFFNGSGACLLVARDLVHALDNQLFDAELFAFHEDVDLGWVARLLGFKVVFCPLAICRHKEGRTSGGFNPTTAYWGNRNRLRVLLKNYSLPPLLLAFPLALLMELNVSLWYSIARRDPRYVYGFWRGIIWNAENLRSTLGMRRRVQRARRVPDKQIMEKMFFGSLELAGLFNRTSRFRRRLQ